MYYDEKTIDPKKEEIKIKFAYGYENKKKLVHKFGRNLYFDQELSDSSQTDLSEKDHLDLDPDEDK